MWATEGKLLRSYLLLCLISFICLGIPWMQRLLVLGWGLHMVRISKHAQQSDTKFWVLLGFVCISQLPGIVLILVSGWFTAFRGGSEWPNGLMEVWYHPFMYLLELLPPGHLGNWSDMYLETYFIPLGTLALCGACWFITRRVRLARGQI